jgi:hypothetical protein
LSCCRAERQDGSLAGDFGFDPARLGSAPEALKWYQQAELINGRTAMVANAGILIPAVRFIPLAGDIEHVLALQHEVMT